VQGRHLLRPSPPLNEIIVGVLGRAQWLYDVRICAFIFVSSHYHLLLDVDNARQLANSCATQYATREAVTLSPLPCWKDLSADARRTRVRSLIGEIETEAAARRARTGGAPLGMAVILGQHPHHHPRHLKKSPAPLFHVISHAARRELYEGYAWFVAAFRQAAEKLKAGDRSAAFPAGCFPPALPFVGG
jgi:hypothetical protein